MLFLELSCLTVSGLATIIVLLGYEANRFSGTNLFTSLLPFAGGILLYIMITATFILLWRKVREKLAAKSRLLPAFTALLLAILTSCLLSQEHFSRAYGYYRTMMGGKKEAARVTLTHQVFAAYRRLDGKELQRLIDRAEPYRPAIVEAANRFNVDPNLLFGLASTESSFVSRQSKDGGHGLLQITAIPAGVTANLDDFFNKDSQKLTNPRYNIFAGAATLQYYLKQMNRDLFLGILAYNIGPANGGLRFIMQQYGVTDFITIQPYLQRLPRDDPIRVLAYALAFRINEKEGKLLAYEEKGNAQRIQDIGIPGLDTAEKNNSE